MRHYIKTGYWKKSSKKLDGWLDLDSLIGVNNGTSVVQSNTIVIPHSSIITLPSTSLEAIPAQGDGIVAIPILGIANIDTTGGAYTNATDASLSYVDNAGNNLSSPAITQTLLSNPTSQIIQIPCPALYPGSGSFSGIIVTNQPFTVSVLNNQPVYIADYWAGIGDYSDGNSANSITLTTYYITIEL